MKDSIKILFVEDVLRDVELNWRELEKGGIVFKKLLVDNRKDFLEGLESFKPDIILSDYSLPQFDGMQALLLRNELAPQTPFIVVTGSVNEEVAVECMKAGADDYVIKEHLTRLPFAVKEALEQHTIIIEKRAAELLLKENEEKLQSIFSAAPVGIGLVVDRVFIEVNDTFCKMTGYNRKELLGKNAEGIYAKDEQNESAAIVIYRHIADKGTGSVETRFKCKDGRVLNILLSSTPLDKDDLTKGVTFIAMDISERKRAEEALHASEEKHRTLIEQSIDGIVISDEHGNVSVWNKRMESITGIQQGETIGRPLWEIQLQLIPVEQKTPELLGQLRNGLKNILESKMEWTGESREQTIINVNGTHKVVQDSSFIIKTNSKKYFGSIIRDISERKQAEEKLKENYSRLNLAMQSANMAWWEMDISTGMVVFEKRKAEMLGYAPEKFNHYKDFMALVHPDDSDKAMNAMRKHLDGTVEKYEVEYRILNNSGEYKWFYDIGSIVKKDSEGKPLKVTGLVIDITERKQAEDKLKLLNRAVEASSVSVVITDAAGNINYVNPYFTELTGYSYEEALGKNPRILKSGHQSKEFYKDLWDTILSGKDWIGEFQNRKKNGELYWEKAVISPILNSNGEVTNFVAIKEDVTERKRTMEELGAAKDKAEESDRLKSAFLTNMSHEIRTPMNGIIGFTELLKEPNLSSDDQQDFIQTIQISGARMLNTINSIVDMSKIESGLMKVDIQETNLNEKIEFTYKFFKPEVEIKGLKFLVKTGLTAKEAIIKTDNEKVYGILTNLVRNAIKFTYEGSIEFGYVLKSDSEVVERSRSAELEFFVKDTGVGIPQNQKELIFERFRQGSESHTRGYEGSGLGLSICKSYVEMLGGRIWVESEEGKGSTFYFTLPYNPVSEETSTIENVVYTATKEVQIKKLKILIVEDDEISYSLLTRMLQNISTEVLHAITGVEAVAFCRNNSDLDLVLMDIRMPQMNGLEATQQIRQFDKDIIIIAQTAYGFSDDREMAIEAGCNDYITKPINQTLLKEIIKRHCNKKPMIIR